MSNELAQRLIKLPKTIEGGERTINTLDEKSRLILSNYQEPEVEFLFEITLHRKITFKISLHHQEHNLREGLVRIDYKGGHKNPENITDDVPDFVKPYLGYFFLNEPHIHIYVYGFKDLAWAVPLEAYKFPILAVENSDDLRNAINAFAREINIITPFYIQNSLL